VWDLETGRALRTLEGHSGYVNGLAVTPDGQRAVSASYDKTLKVWDLDTGTLCARWKATFLRSMAWRSRRMLRGLFQRGGTAC
jgi:WD40 repeat protein